MSHLFCLIISYQNNILIVSTFTLVKLMKITKLRKFISHSKHILLGIGVFSVFFISFTKADFTDFLNQLETMDIPVEQIMDADGISRYTLSRLLNALECKDCIYPDQTMVNDYSSSFWSQFSQLPGKDFDDIAYLGGNWNQTSYYYCVAYV